MVKKNNIDDEKKFMKKTGIYMYDALGSIVCLLLNKLYKFDSTSTYMLVAIQP